MKAYKTIFILLVLSLVLSIYLYSAKSIIFNQEFYEKEFSKNKVENATIISQDLIGFFQDKNQLPDIFNKNESLHMQDVKGLIKRISTFLLILSLINIVLLSLLIFYSESISKSLSKLSIFTSILALIMPIPLLLFNFTNLFTKFHLIFFQQGNFYFSLDSTLITLFPEQFFYLAFIRIILSSSIIAFLLILEGFISSRISSN